MRYPVIQKTQFAMTDPVPGVRAFQGSGRYNVKIPASFKLERKKWIGEDTQNMGEEFLSNWFDDLKFYLKRAPGLKEEMLQYL